MQKRRDGTVVVVLFCLIFIFFSHQEGSDKKKYNPPLSHPAFFARIPPSHKLTFLRLCFGMESTVTKWLSDSASDSYVCMASYMGPGFEPIWGVTMRELRALDSYTATKSLIYTCICTKLSEGQVD